MTGPSLEQVHALARLVPIFPCRAEPLGRAKAKSPLTTNGFLDATQDVAAIAAWYQAHPGCLWGVPTGSRTRIVAIDYDPDKAAPETQEWIAEHTNELVAARTHTTARNGRHYIYRSSNGSMYTTGVNVALGGRKRPGLDIRGEGGYIIWWPLQGLHQQNQAPELPAALLAERAFHAPQEPRAPATASPEAWQKDRALVSAALAYIDPQDYDRWYQTGMSLHHGSEGSDDGFDLWHTWSAGLITGEMPHSYSGVEICRQKWASFGKGNGSRPIRGLGSLFAEAKAAGWVRPQRHEAPAEVPRETLEREPGCDDEIIPSAPPPQEGDPGALLLAIAEPMFLLHTLDTLPVSPRPFIYRRHYMRGMVGVTAAAGGAGKSSIVLVELVSIALGRDLLDANKPLPVGPLNVWYHNGEDPLDEIRRRLSAICRYYEINTSELIGKLFFTVGRENPMIVAHETRDYTLAAPETVAAITAHIRQHQVSVLAIDPFVSTHRVSENSNEAMEVVMCQWRQIADQAGVAVEAVHHFRKTNGNEASVDDIRGASSMIGAARSARIFASMSKEEAAKCGVELEQRRRFVWEGQAKANMYVASDRRIWREMVSVDLQNAAPPYDSDKVGVATHWEFPNELSAITDELYPIIIGTLRGCNDPLKRRYSNKSNGWVGLLVCECIATNPNDPQTKVFVSRAVDSWIASGVLRKKDVWDSKQARNTAVVEVVTEE